MPQLPTSKPVERRPSNRWIWLSLLGLILLCAAAIHRRQMPFQKSKDLSGYNLIYLSSADDNLAQLRELDGDDDDDFDEGDEGDDELVLVGDDGPDQGDSPRLERKWEGSRIYGTVQRAQFQDWEH